MNVNEPKPCPHELILLQEKEKFLESKSKGGRQGLQQRKNFKPVLQIPAGQFPNDKGMGHNLSFLEKILQVLATRPKMLDPNRRINEDLFQS